MDGAAYMAVVNANRTNSANPLHSAQLARLDVIHKPYSIVCQLFAHERCRFEPLQVVSDTLFNAGEKVSFNK
jgi:hypothetical protein